MINYKSPSKNYNKNIFILLKMKKSSKFFSYFLDAKKLIDSSLKSKFKEEKNAFG